MHSTCRMWSDAACRNVCDWPSWAPHGAALRVYRPRHALAVAAAVPQQHPAAPQGLHEDPTKQPYAVDPGLGAFKSMIAERRFTCTVCGKCCTGDGEVWITDEEAARIAAHLGLPLTRFYQHFTRAYSKVEGFKLLRSKDNPTRDCVFLQPDNTCSIHTVRPLQCSTYPWWPDLMNQDDWDWEKDNICEGFDHPDAPPTDKDEAARQLRAATALEYRRMLSRKPSKKQKKAAAAALVNLPPGGMMAQAAPPHSRVDSVGAMTHHKQYGSSNSSSSSGAASARQASPAGLDPQLSSPGDPQGRVSEQPAGGSATRKKAAAQDKWKQRLSRLQELAGPEE